MIDCFGFYVVSAIFQPCNGQTGLTASELCCFRLTFPLKDQMEDEEDCKNISLPSPWTKHQVDVTELKEKIARRYIFSFQKFVTLGAYVLDYRVIWSYACLNKRILAPGVMKSTILVEPSLNILINTECI